MDELFGFNIGLFINKSSVTPGANLFSFRISDSIYSPFPGLEVSFPDGSGLFTEFGNFTQGVPLNIKYGIAENSDLFDVIFRSTGRDIIQPLPGTPGLNGNLSIKGLHDSYFENRKAPNIALKEMTVSDAVKKLFPSEKKLKVEDTKGKIESYAFDDPYQFTKDVLLPQATNGKVRPFVFYRNLLNELHFESINFLEDSPPSEKLTFGDTESESLKNTFNSFLPFNENLKSTLPYFSVVGRRLKNDLTFETEIKSVATDAKDKIPVIADTRIHNMEYLGRQFNPKVDYDHLNNAFYADAMRAGFFVDKAMGTLPLHTNLVAGKTVEIAVSLFDVEKKIELSETFSSKWLITQSFHIWDGSSKQGQTQLILCRSSMKPRRDSIIMDKAFSD